MANKKEEKKTVTTTITMDEKLKNDFSEICEELGMTFSGAITIFAKQMVRERKLPFTPNANVNVNPDIYVECTKPDSGFERYMAYMRALQGKE